MTHLDKFWLCGQSSLRVRERWCYSQDKGTDLLNEKQDLIAGVAPAHSQPAQQAQKAAACARGNAP